MTIQPTNPFHVSRAYGVQQPGLRPKVQTSQSPARDAATAPNIRPVANPESANPSVLRRVSSPSLAEQAGLLVGARISGRIDFSGESPRHHDAVVGQKAGTHAVGSAFDTHSVEAGRIDRAYSGVTGAGAGAYAMYRRPTDKNEAAVAVAVGRSLDTTA
jgi:hypothetical protein